ncbi:RNA-directed DNA polymerase, eukaryota [Tanacetum coccineum]
MPCVGDSNPIVVSRAEIGNASTDELEARRGYVKQLGEINRREGIDLAQKASVKWNVDGDENSKYFHGLVNQKRRQVAIRGIMVDGAWEKNPERVKNEFKSYFSEKFSPFVRSRPRMEFEFSRGLSTEQSAELEVVFSKVKIKEAVWGCVEDDFFKAINHFQSTEKIPLGRNSSFVTLIPKVVDPIITSVVEDLISTKKSTFVKGRQIMDGHMILNEILNWCKQEKKKTLIFKVDFEKAYDSVCWDYLQNVIFKIRFGRKWCAWIRGCLESSVTFILVNGSPTDELKIRRGLRQGDPLFHFLFILAMKGLHMLISRAIQSSQLHGLQIGLKINLAKCRLMGVGVPIDEITEMANIIGCEASTIPFVYLGVSVGVNMTRIRSWKELIDKFKTRLSRWKVKTLSVGGRLKLLKSVLGSIAIYYMSIFKTPIAVIKEIEAIRNQFFLGADTDENKMTWIKWNKVMASKKDGGLGIGSLYGFNRALLFKWKWRFMAYPSAFWVLVIKSLFGHHGGMQDSEPRGNAGSIWINILKVSRELEKKNVHLDDFLKRKVGDGLETRFWDDYWISDGLLKDLYPRVYNLDQDPESVVANRLNLAPNAPFLRRNPRGGAEKDQWVALLSLLETHVSSNQRDRWIWTGDGDGIYSVKCGRKLIDKGTLCLDTYATRWLKEMPTKVNIFIWRMLLNKLPTRMNLMNRGITVQSNQCGIYDTGDETVNHLMLHCDLARDVWALVGRWWTLDFPSVLSIRELMSWVDDTRLHILAKKVLHVVVGTTAWSI